MPVKEEVQDELTIKTPDEQGYLSNFMCEPSCCQDGELFVDGKWQLFRSMPLKEETPTIKDDGYRSSYVFSGGKNSLNDEVEYVKCCMDTTCMDVSGCTLAKIEMDVAEALTELSRMVNVRTQNESRFDCNNRGLHWFRKRKRSRRLSKDAGFIAMKTKPRRYSNEAVHLDGPETAVSVKKSCSCSSRAESPSSPLECQNSLVGSSSGGRHALHKKHPHNAHPHFQADLGLGNGTYGLATMRSKLTAKRKPKALSPTVKLEEEGDTKVAKEYMFHGLSLVDFTTEKLFEESGHADYHIANKHRAPLSEVDKEARRLRRVQANRESARLTIKRKQILCEELKRRATCLAVENKGLKQKKESLMQELYSLKDHNNLLKQQLAGDIPGIIGTRPTGRACKLPLQSLSSPALPIPGLTSSWPTGSAASTVETTLLNNNGTSGCDAIQENCSDDLSSISEEPGHLSLFTVAPLSSQEVIVGVKQTLQSFVRGIDDCKPPLFENVDWQLASGVHSQAFAVSALQPGGYTPGGYCSSVTGSQAEAPFDGSLHSTYMFTTRRTSPAVVLAAEARRRRKELTRRKFLQSRAFRPRCRDQKI